jgi:hypothetical protein
MSERSEAESFVTDRVSPLKLIKPEKGPALIAQFQGSVQVSGRLLFIRDIEVRRSRDLRVLFYPDQVSAELLPRANDRPRQRATDLQFERGGLDTIRRSNRGKWFSTKNFAASKSRQP